MKKKTLITVISLIIFVGIIALIYNLTKSDNLIGKTKTVDKIKFSDAKIINNNGAYTFYVTVTTESPTELEIEDFDAHFYDKDNNKILTLSGYIGDIDNMSKKEIKIETKEDLSKAYEINYTIRINDD